MTIDQLRRAAQRAADRAIACAVRKDKEGEQMHLRLRRRMLDRITRMEATS